MGLTIDFFDKYDIKKLFDEYNIGFQKKFGQNFLMDRDFASDSVSSMELHGRDLVLEIGSGIGTFTHLLLATGADVTAFELDYKFVDILNRLFGDNEHFRCVQGDVLKTLPKTVKDLPPHNRLIIYGSLPYYITTPILEKIFYTQVDFDEIDIIVQAEMQGRLLAQPNTERYCLLSLLVNTFSEPTVCANIPAASFLPEPNVDSIFVKMTKKANNIIDKRIYFQTAKEIFRNRRKKLINNLLTNSIFCSITKDEIINIFSELNLKEDIRGEALSIEQVTALSNKLSEKLQHLKGDII